MDRRAGKFEGNSSSEEGFALIEVIAAFAILSIALIALFNAVGQAARNAQRINVKIEALDLAQSLVASTGHEQPLRAGMQTGVTERGLRWTVEISPYGNAASFSQRPIEGYWVAVRVQKDRPDYQPALVGIRTIKLGKADE